jgi:hypothetical protein
LVGAEAVAGRVVVTSPSRKATGTALVERELRKREIRRIRFDGKETRAAARIVDGRGGGVGR